MARGGKREKAGRKPGAPNALTTAAKDVIQQAAVELGGAVRLVKWAKEEPANERAFWSSIYPRLLPLQVTGKDGGKVEVEHSGAVALEPSEAYMRLLNPNA